MKPLMECDGWLQLTPAARLMVFVVRAHHDVGVDVVSKTTMLEQTGLPFPVLKEAALLANDHAFLAKAIAPDGSPGVRLHELICADLALANAPSPRKVKDAEKLPPGFVRLWQLDARRADREGALREYLRINPDEELQAWMAAAYAQQLALWRHEGRERDRVPHLRTWLHNKRWRDEVRTGALGGKNVIPIRERNTDAAVEEALRRRGLK
jgi:hypothetical protein